MARKKYLSLVLLVCANMLCVMPNCLVSQAADAEQRAFTGSWVATGSEETLTLGTGREAALFKLSGHVNLHEEIGGEIDYWAECIGLADTESGSSARCVWKSLNGIEIYLTLEGRKLVEGSSVTGQFIGGTQAAEGITGSIEFKWSTMSMQGSNDKITIGGYAKELRGNYQLP